MSESHQPNRILLSVLQALVWACFLLAATEGQAQLGPDLRPPGLDSGEDLADPAFEESKVAEGEEEADRSVAAEWELNTDSVVFSAASKRQLVSEAPSTVHVITDKQIRRYGWRSLAETLRMVPGVQTRTWLAQYQSVMIRGLLGTETNNTRILWLENGVPMNDVRDAGIWLDETYPMELVKRVEVVLGPGSALYGTGAFQGVVNIFTKDPRDVPEYGEYRVAFGSHRTLRSSALGAWSSGNFGVLGFASANSTLGPGLISDFRLRQLEREAAATAVRNGDSPTDPAYDPPPVPINSDRDWQNLYLKLKWTPVRLSVGFRNILAGFDGAEFFPAERYRFNRREVSSDLVWEQSLLDNLGILTLVSYRFNQNDYKDYFDLDLDRIVEIQQFDEVVSDPRYPDRLDEKVNYTSDQHKVFALAQIQWQLFSSNELILGVGGRYEFINSPDFETSEVQQDSFNGSVFLQDEQRFFDGDLILTAGGRLDTHREFGPQLSFRGAVLYKWTDWLLSRISYGRAYKEPSMYQLFIDHFNARGNDSLDAETLDNVELSTVARPIPEWTIRLDGFATFMDNLILNDFDRSLAVPFLGIDGKFVSRQQNAARILGFEISTKADFDMGFSFFAHYNFLDSRASRCNDCEFELLDYDARHRAGMGLAWSNDDYSASLANFLVGETRDTAPTAPGEVTTDEGARIVPLYATFQPSFSARLPGDLGALLQGSYTVSEGMAEAPGHHFYYQMLGVPVPRLTFLFALTYPYRN